VSGVWIPDGFPGRATAAHALCARPERSRRVPVGLAGSAFWIPDGFAGGNGLMLLVREFTASRVKGSRRARGSGCILCTHSRGGTKPPLHCGRSFGAVCLPEAVAGRVSCLLVRLQRLPLSGLGVSAVKSCNGPQHERISRKPFTIRSYAKTRLQLLWNPHLQIIGLKVPWNETVTKMPGGGASALVANTRLKPHFSQRSPNQLQIIGPKLKSRGTNACCGRGETNNVTR